jgi:glyoxylase I family protein
MGIEVRGVCPMLQVYDMPTSVRFYRDTLGFEVVATSPNLGGEDKFHWCLLRLCGSEVMLSQLMAADQEVRSYARIADAFGNSTASSL